MISRNDGLFNNDYGHQRDTVINANTMINLSRPYYTEKDKQLIDMAKAFPKLDLSPVMSQEDVKKMDPFVAPSLNDVREDEVDDAIQDALKQEKEWYMRKNE